MADPTFFDLFKSTWAQNGLTEGITDLQYKTGWSFIGSVPPSVEQFNKVQQTTDERLAWIYKQLDGLAAVTGRPLSANGLDALSYAQQNLNAGNLKTGTVSVARGGTGLDTVAAGSFLMGADNGPLVSRTPGEVFTDIGVAKALDDTLKAVGLGGVSDEPAVVDLDDPTLVSGLYCPKGTPGPGNWVGNGFILHKVYGTAGFQLANQVGSGVLQFRERSGNAWSTPITLANLNSPSFTGTPRAETPAAGDKSTRLATTAYIEGSFPRIYSIASLPSTNVGPILVAEAAEVWIWVSTAFFTGYRSPLCGRALDGHTAAPLASEVDAVGGLLSKSAYAGLWGYAQEQGLAKTEAVWSANRGAHWFSDYSATQFRVPDLRDMFRRFTGTDADTANARDMGSRQTAATGPVDLTVWTAARGGGALNVLSPARLAVAGVTENTGSYAGYGQDLYLGRGVGGVGAESRPTNVAYRPRVHT
ncbi:hypothetical protein [Achromobacter marplatensis]|uniref:hypothetical protein n=1 Tax=Achromobacter marplatensis TaxID=470868 RepID=UPI0039F6814F